MVNLSSDEIDLLLLSLQHSKRNIEEGSDSYSQKLAKVAAIEHLARKLTEAA